MTFYDKPETAKQYIKMCEGYNAAKQLHDLYDVLPNGARVLEIGSGPGNDFALLAQRYHAVASDNVHSFVAHLHEHYPEADILELDAVTLDTNEKFDAIYSNKVLHHLDDAQLAQSFEAQARIVNKGGMVCHLIWQVIEEIPEGFGLPFIARDADAMQAAMGTHFKIFKTIKFGEFEDGDSLMILARKT